MSATEQQVLDTLDSIGQGLTEQETDLRELISQLQTANQSPAVNLDNILSRAQALLTRVGTIKSDVTTVVGATGGDTSTSGGTAGGDQAPSSTGAGETSSPGGADSSDGASGTQASDSGSA